MKQNETSMKKNTVMQRWANVKTQLLPEWERVHCCLEEAAKIILDKTGQVVESAEIPMELEYRKTGESVEFFLVAGAGTTWKGRDCLSLTREGTWWDQRKADRSLEAHTPSSLLQMERAMDQMKVLNTGAFISQWEKAQE